jgi:hypothetical protein
MNRDRDIDKDEEALDANEDKETKCFILTEVKKRIDKRNSCQVVIIARGNIISGRFRLIQGY